MPYLTSEEIVDLERHLAQWQTPEAMSRLVDDAMSKLGSVDLFNQGGLALLRDAWIAAKFGQIQQAQEVHLVADTWPDFELKIDERVEAYEAVEADAPERRRGDEYRNSTGEIQDDSVEDWVARADQAPEWLETACRKKANKRYGARVNLVVYLNLSEYGIRQKEIESCFPSATEAVKNSFDAVWVLWKERTYLVWKDGEPHY